MRLGIGAAAGDMGGLRSLVAETSEAELQTVLLHSLLSSDADAMEAVAYDPVVLSGLNDWLHALLEDARAFHVIDLLLQVSVLLVHSCVVTLPALSLLVLLLDRGWMSTPAVSSLLQQHKFVKVHTSIALGKA